MADISNSNWSEADSSNSNPAPDGVPSGILPSQIGGVIRSMRGATKRAWNRSNAILVSTGTAAALVLTYEQAPPSYVKGEVYRFFVHVSNTGATTININSLGARALNRADGTALSAGELTSGQVATIVYDGANFLHQSVGSRFFKDNVSITLPTDAVLTLEDTSAAANTYRRKSIFSTKNAGGGGNDWLFRQTRPSDGAFEDFTLRSGQGGTIYTTGNFNPALKADLTGASFSGDITTYRAAAPTQGVLYLGSGGSRYLYYDGTNYTMPGAQLLVNGSQVWKRDDFNPDLKASLNATVRFGTVSLGVGNANLYSDGNSNNVRLRSGAAGSEKYAGLNDDGTFQLFNGGLISSGNITSTGSITTNGSLTVGNGQASSSITMVDIDEGTRHVHNNSGSIGFLGSDGGWKLRVYDNGSLWCAQLGDLNTRIEDRAYAHAVAQASAYANGRVAKTGDTMTGDLTVNKPYPFINMLYPAVKWWGMQIRENGWLYFPEDNNANFNIAFTPGGNIWSNAFGGTLTDRIETRAQAWANTRQAALGYTPVEQGGGPYQATNKIRLGWDGGSLRLSVDGGDHERLLHRSWINPIIDMRWAYAGDLGNDWNQYGGTFAEPYSGAAMTTRLISTLNSVTYWSGARWRYLQKQDSYGNWYTIGYV